MRVRDANLGDSQRQAQQEVSAEGSDTVRETIWGSRGACADANGRRLQRSAPRAQHLEASLRRRVGRWRRRWVVAGDRVGVESPMDARGEARRAGRVRRHVRASASGCCARPAKRVLPARCRRNRPAPAGTPVTRNPGRCRRSSTMVVTLGADGRDVAPVRERVAHRGAGVLAARRLGKVARPYRVARRAQVAQGPVGGPPPVSWSQVDVVVVAVSNRRLCTDFSRAPAHVPACARPSGSPAAWSASYSAGERIPSFECSRVGL
jgi:hypothetical protein